MQPEEAVERPEEKRRQSPSPPPSPGNGRPRRRSICLLVPGETHPLVLFPELIPGCPTTEMILEEERVAAWQCSRQLLGPKAGKGRLGMRRARQGGESHGPGWQGSGCLCSAG
ncbi:uncharacterized protein ACIB01_015703 [Guaruba guarouba]